MADRWSSPLPWSPHQEALARWAASRWGWSRIDPDWPSALALLVAAQDEGHTALLWDRAPEVWARRWAPGTTVPEFTLPHPDRWPPALFDGWLSRRGDCIQTQKDAQGEARLLRPLVQRLTPHQGPGAGQDAAVARAATDRLILVVGGPGTGKTTTLKRLVAAWSQANPGRPSVLAAPTGRAASRARETFADAPVTPECLTLHRLLGLRPGLGQPWHGPHRPLPFGLVIVDEASMLDLRTGVALVEALSDDSSLVLVGDPGQLPSVEAGSVFGDLLGRPEFLGATVRLTERFRLDDQSQTLGRVFDRLQSPSGDPEALARDLETLGDGRAFDFRWEVTSDEDPGPRAIKLWGSASGMTVERLHRRGLLSPVHGGPGGTQSLGALLDRSLGRAPGTLGDGLPWMIRRNLPHLDLSNGDRGLVIRREGRLWFEAAGHPPHLFALVAEDGEPAWAVTVHKSQGSEYDEVVLVLPPQDSPGIVRELVYTGLTRARRRAVLVASRPALIRALGRGTDRMSGIRSWGTEGP